MSLEFKILKIARATAAAVAPFRICKAGADGAVAQATAVGEKFQGVSDQNGSPAGGRVEMHVEGVCPVEYGGNVSNGDFLTSDASGRAVTAVATNRYFAIAFEDGDLGTIGSCKITHGIV
jgi:hypothetical protein